MKKTNKVELNIPLDEEKLDILQHLSNQIHHIILRVSSLEKLEELDLKVSELELKLDQTETLLNKFEERIARLEEPHNSNKLVMYDKTTDNFLKGQGT
jgi:tetrahydromethanopterin S-methyltransferase subunit B